MNFVYFLILLVITIIILMYIIALKINFVFDTTEEKMRLTAYWLYPFIKAEIFMLNKKPMLKVSLFNIKIYEKAMKKKKSFHENLRLVKDINVENINLTAYYGFNDKFMVGIISMLINYATQFLTIESIEQKPDFMAHDDYIFINADATMKIVPALKSLASH